MGELLSCPVLFTVTSDHSVNTRCSILGGTKLTADLQTTQRKLVWTRKDKEHTTSGIIKWKACLPIVKFLSIIF